MNTEYKHSSLSPKPKILLKFTFKLPTSLMSRPCSSARGPKPPIAPKPRLLHEPEEKCCLNTRNSLHQCRNGGQILSDEELDQDNEPGGLIGEGTEVAQEPYFNCNNNGNEEEENEQEFNDKITDTVCTEGANSVGMQKLFDIECNPDLTDVVETADIECMLDIEPDSCGAGEALADTDGLSEFDIASDNEIADQYPCAPQHEKDPEDLGMNEDSPPHETDTAQEQNEGHWYADKSHTCECFHQQVHFPQSPESLDSFADASSLHKECQQNLKRLSCTLCKLSENLDDQHVISCVGDGELQNITDSPDLLQHSEETGDFFKLYSVSDAECTTEVVNDVDTEAQSEFSSNNCMGEESIGLEGQPALKSSASPKPFCVLSDRVDDDICEAPSKEAVFNENQGSENPKEEQARITDEKHASANYGDIDNDSLCQDTEDLHQLECVSSEDYVEIGEEDDTDDKIGTPQKSIVKDSKCKSRCADASFQLLNSKPRFRLCSITMPVDMDMSTTSELTDTLVFTDTADVFGNDIDIEGHIVPFLEETDTDQDNISDEHVYEEAGLDSEGENFLSMDRKSIVTRSRSLSGKVPGYVPETVPEETGTEYQTNEYCTVALEKSNQSESEQLEINQILPSSKSRHFFLYPRSFSVEGGDTTMSLYEENDCSVGEDRIKRNEDNRSLPCFAGSSGSFSQRSHLPSSGMSTPTSVVDIPPPFELAYITKKPITKSSPSLLLENDSSDKQKKKKSSFKRFFTLKFRRKRENKVHLDVSVSSSRSSSESSHHGPVRVLEIDRRSLGSSPQPILRSGKPQRASDSPTTFLFYKDSKRKSPPKPFSNRCVSRVESFEDRSRPPFMPLPLTKPRSISFPNADMSDYENIPAISSDYENIQIPSRRPTREAMFAEFHDDPSRTLSSANENDGYVDMSSFVGFESKAQTPQLESERVHMQPEMAVPVSVGLPGKTETEDDQGRTSEEEDGGAEHTHDRQTDGRSRAFYIAKDLVDSEKVHVKGLKLLQEDFRVAVAGSVGEDGEPAVPEDSFSEIVGKLPEVYQLHCCLLPELENRVKHWEESQRIADVFLAQRVGFTVFTDYISQYDRSMALLDESCQRSPTFAAIVKQFGGLASGNVTVKHQLLQVIIRVLQYRMLLTDYLNNLSPDSTEYEDTQAALLIISEVADQANENLNQGENLLRLVHIEYSVGDQRDLIQPGRKFVKEGTLMKVSRKSRQPRHLFLMNDVLLYTFPQQDGKYRLKNTLHLTGMKISKPTLENVQYALKIEVNEVSITLSTSSSGERDDWFHTLSHTVDDHSRGLGASGSSVGEVRDKLWMSLGEKAPTLVPVSHVMMCMNCTSDFSLTLRRHHCHACGKIICRGCSRNKYPLKYLKDRMAKVCDHCYTELKKQGGDVAEVSPEASPRTKRVSRPLSAVFQNIHPPSLWKQRKTTATLNQVPMEAEGSTTSGTLHRCKRSKKNWKRLWFLVKDKDKIASESLPLLGFTVKLPEGPAGEDANNAFPLYQKKSLYCTFKAEDNSSAQRWINAIEEATVL